VPQITQIQVRRDPASTWTSVNPTLASGEIGFETDTGKLKIGTGSTAWNSLTYVTDGSKLTGTIAASTATTATNVSGIVLGANGGTGVANTGKTITVSGNTTVGSSTNTVSLATTGNTSVTLPTSGTLIGSNDSKTVTATMLSDYATAPTLWFSKDADIGLNNGNNVASTTYDCFNLTNGVTVANSSLYYVDYCILGTIANVTGASQSIRMTIAGNAVANFNFATALGMGALASSTGSTFALQDQLGYINVANTTYSIGAVTSSQTAMSFSLSFRGVLRTGATGQYFQPKIGVNAVSASGTTITVLRESYGSLRLIGSSSPDFKYPTGSWS